MIASTSPPIFFEVKSHLAGRDARLVRPSSGGHICVMSSLAGCAPSPNMRHNKIRTHEPCVPTGQWMSRLKFQLAFRLIGRDARLVRPQFMPFAIDKKRNV